VVGLGLVVCAWLPTTKAAVAAVPAEPRPSTLHLAQIPVSAAKHLRSLERTVGALAQRKAGGSSAPVQSLHKEWERLHRGAPAQKKFHVPIVPETRINSTVYLKVQGAWHLSKTGISGLCVGIVRRPEDCTPSVLRHFRPCEARVLWRLSAPGSFLGFELRRPSFTVGASAPASASSHSVCLWAHDSNGELNSTLGNVFLDLPEQNPMLLGSISYYPMPAVIFNDRIERVGVRTFLNPGWQKEIHLQCRNCSAASRIAVRPLETSNHCTGLRGALAAAVIALQHEHEHERHWPGLPVLPTGQLKFGPHGTILSKIHGLICAPPKYGPCHGYIETAFSTGHLRDDGGVDGIHPVSGNTDAAPNSSGYQVGDHVEAKYKSGADWYKATIGEINSDGIYTIKWDDGDIQDKIKSEAQIRRIESQQVAKFRLGSHIRLAAKERRHLFHHRSAVCFYPDDGAPQGWLAGYIEFHMDGPDVQAFVGFVCFFGIALPLICMVTVLLHVNKSQRCKQHVRELRLQLQREQLEAEITQRRTQPATRSPSASSRSPTGAARGTRSSPSASTEFEASLLARSDRQSRSPLPRVQISALAR